MSSTPSEGIKKTIETEHQKPVGSSVPQLLSLTKGLHARSDSHSRTTIPTMIVMMSWHSWRKHSDSSFLALALPFQTQGEVGIWKAV